jgi:hypothetical protein
VSTAANPGRPSRFSAADRLMAIAPMLEHCRQREPRLGPKRRPSLDQIARQAAADHGVSPGTVWRWYCHFKRGGYFALMHQQRSDAGASRYIAKHPDIETMIRARISRGRSPHSIWQSLSRILGSASPSYHVVYGYMKSRASLGGRPSSPQVKALATP